jgi:hypothetical protein
MANKRISHHRLLVDTAIKGNLWGLLERGVQESMDKEELFDETLEVAIGYTGSVGTSLWSKIVRATLHPDASRGDCPIRGRQYLPSGLS